MPQPTGNYLPLSLPRRLMTDLLSFARAVPSAGAERRLNLRAVLEARERAVPRPSWCAVFTKAWALTCAVHPPLRRAYLGCPWPRLYEHPASVASIAVERPYDANDAVFFLQITQPETRALTEIDARIRWFRDRPLGSAGAVRRQLLLARQPWPLRRLLCWLALAWGGDRRARLFGTFGVHAHSALGAETLHLPCLLTTTLSYGLIDPAGGVTVRVTYDSRTLDGGDLARALVDLERFLKHEIVNELRYLEGTGNVAA